MKRKSILTKVLFVVLVGSFLSSLLIGLFVYLLTGDLAEFSITVGISLLVFIIPVALMIFLMNKLIISKIKKVVNAMNEVSMGNLDVEIKVEGNDELAELAESFDRMRLSMKTIVEKLEKGEL